VNVFNASLALAYTLWSISSNFSCMFRDTFSAYSWPFRGEPL